MSASLGETVSITSAMSEIRVGASMFSLRSEKERPMSVGNRLSSLSAGALARRIRKSLPRITIGMLTLVRRLLKSSLASASSMFLFCNSSLTVVSSSFVDCSSSFAVSSSSLVLCSSSLLDWISSLAAFSSSIPASFSSIMDCR